MTVPGRFVWYELMTTDPEGAKAFYAHVVGWKTQKFGEGPYTMWVSAAGPLGGVDVLPEQAKAMGAPSHWMSHVTVTNVDASVAQAEKLGARVYVPPMDIPTVGRFSVIADPQGATISLFTPSGGEMAPHDGAKHGEFCWSELMTSDAEAALAFYGELLGWKQISEFDMGPMGKYRLYGLGETTFGGMMTKPKEMPMPPSWIYYINVDDFDAAIERAKEKGGKLVNGPNEVPGGMRIAQFVDPQGAFFALHGK